LFRGRRRSDSTGVSESLICHRWSPEVPGRGFSPAAALSLPPPPLSGDTPQRPDKETALAHVLRDRLEWGPSHPKPPPFPAGIDVSGYPGWQATWGAPNSKRCPRTLGIWTQGYGSSDTGFCGVSVLFGMIDSVSFQLGRVMAQLRLPHLIPPTPARSVCADQNENDPEGSARSSKNFGRNGILPRTATRSVTVIDQGKRPEIHLLAIRHSLYILVGM
jgi:hypothetical protein